MSSSRPAFRFTLAEFSGALADLGVMLPLVVALITLNGVDATAAFVGIGMAYLLVAVVYRLPIPVQPLKSVSSLALALGLPPVYIVAAALWNAMVFLGMGLARMDRVVQKLFPHPVVRGIQAALAVLLLRAAWRLAWTPSPGWKGFISWGGVRISLSALVLLGAAALLVLCLFWKREWAALVLIGFGVVLSLYHHGLPSVPLRVHLPRLFPLVPSLQDMARAFVLLALPQIPLSLGNSIYATADAARVYFGKHAEHVTTRRLMLTLGTSDALIALLGGVPVCHGCGGLTAHYRLGARTGGAPLMIGGLFLLLGVFVGPAAHRVLNLIPLPVLAVLLAYVAIQHAGLLRDVRGWRNWLVALWVPLVTLFSHNLAWGFLSAAAVYYLLAIGKARQTHLGRTWIVLTGHGTKIR